jgi:phosphoribosylformylglycinamidine synthase
MRARVLIMPKDGVLDPQGEAIRMAISFLGFDDVRGVRQGKIIDLELATDDRAAAEAEGAAMCRTLLANEVIESWQVEFP